MSISRAGRIHFSLWLALMLCFPLGAALAQGSGASDPLAQEMLRAFQQRASGSQTLDAPLQSTMQVQTPQSNMPAQAVPFTPLIQSDPAAGTIGLSALERLMSLRVGRRVQQFGYDMFGRPAVTRQSGGIQDNYILGEGDEIVVGLAGQESGNYRARVDRDGHVSLPRLPPIAAGGRSFGAFRADLEAAVAHAYIGTQVSVAVGTVRQVGVRVVGEVNSPGLFNLSGLSSAMDALNLAGGVKKTGSLRDIRIVRGSATLRLDLYALLADSRGGDITLADGDRIVVPLLAHTAAVVGQVKRPAIYEMPPGQSEMRAGELLALAGGPQVPGAYTYSLLQQRADGRREMVPTAPEGAARVHDGDTLFVNASIDVSLARIEVMGAAAPQGYVALGAAPSLKMLFASADMFAPQPGKPLPYMLLGAVLRLDRQTVQRTALPFSPADVVAGRSDLPLQSGDLVYVLNVAEMRYIARGASRAAAVEAEKSGLDADHSNGQRDSAGAPSAALLQTMSGSTLAVNSLAGTPGASTLRLPQSEAQGPSRNRDNAQQGMTDLPLSQSRHALDVGPFAIPDNDALPRLNGIPDPRESGGRQTRSDFSDDGDASSDQNDRADRHDNGLSASELTSDGLPEGAGPMARSPADALRLFVGLDDDERRLFVRALANYYVLVSGEVNNPGAYLVMPQAGLDKVVQAAGGITPNVDLSGFEVSSADVDNVSGTSRTVRHVYKLGADQFSQVALKPLDRIRFNKVFSDRAGEITLYGEVRFPGSYEITRSEKLSSVLARAGGLTDSAYAYGAIFLRRSVAQQEQGVLRREADALESQLVGLMGSVSASRTQISDSEIQYVTQMLARLRQAEVQGGRIAVVIDAQQVAAHPELDIPLEPGDQLYIPRKPSSVVVAGEVMSPSGIQFKAGLTVKDYIARAGGVTEVSDEDHIFIIQPDGSAMLAEDGGWLEEAAPLAPGSVIVVPRTLKPFSWDVVLQTAIQVVSQLSLTAASIAVIGR